MSTQQRHCSDAREWRRSIAVLATALVAGMAICVSQAYADLGSDCYGFGQVSLSIPAGAHFDLPGDREYDYVTVGAGATLDTNGHVLRVRGVLTNNGRITDTHCGGTGGSGGSGGTGGGGVPHTPPASCTPGGARGQPLCSGSGAGGAGGGGGGGGGGGWNTTLGCVEDGAVSGGNGGGGGHGGRGGGRVTLYVKNLDNRGVIDAAGENGQNGGNGSLGGYTEYFCVLVWRDATGGGGGGGGGGDGGDGGTVTVYYANGILLGNIHANAGLGGSGGARGGSQCALLHHDPGPGQHWEYGSPGCPPGSGGCGWGGAGGESDGGTSCGPTAHGYAGDAGCAGSFGVVHVIRDCNCNGIDDHQDIVSGTSPDLNGNDIPDECEVGACCLEWRVDQECTAVGGGRNIAYFAPIGQEFVPTASRLSAVQLPLSDWSRSPVTVRIHEGTISGAVVPNATATVTPDHNGWVTFPFASPASLTVGATYVIEAASTSSWGWDFVSPPTYPNGRAILFGNPDALSNQCFRTLVSEAGECEVTAATECLELGGTWQGAGTTCTPNPCPSPPPGACCYSDGHCEYVTQASCGGTWLGAHISCDPNPCPQPQGACCHSCADLLPTYGCTLTTEADCTGTWLGVYTSCEQCTYPEPVYTCPGDSNCDCLVNFADIDYFVAAIPDNENGWRELYRARHDGQDPPCPFLNNDCTGDAHVNFADIDPFVALIPSSCH